MILLAHDGSIYGDWIARYALQFATREVDRKLIALHVEDGKIRPEIVATRFAQLGADCEEAGVDFSAHHLELVTSTYRSLRQAIPHDPQALLVCGTRIKPNRNAFLRGSVAEQLLRIHQCPVLALRVVHPGLLGAPRDLLLPLAGHADGFERVWPVFKRLLPDLSQVNLLRVMPVPEVRRPYLSFAREQMLRAAGDAYLEAVTAALEEHEPTRTFRLERQVLVASDWAHDVLVQASRLKVQMMLLGVSERSLAHRVLHGSGIERILHDTCCDVGVYRAP